MQSGNLLQQVRSIQTSMLPKLLLRRNEAVVENIYFSDDFTSLTY